MGCVYLITNQHTDKHYVGATSRTLNTRWAEHKKAGPRGILLVDRLIARYGAESFTVQELDRAKSRKELSRLESRYIRRFKSLDPRFGYNKKDGGVQGPHTRQARKKMSAALRVRWENPSYRRRMTAESRRRWKNPTYARKLALALKRRWATPRFVRKMSKISKRKWRDPEFATKYIRAPVFRVCWACFRSFQTRHAEQPFCSQACFHSTLRLIPLVAPRESRCARRRRHRQLIEEIDGSAKPGQAPILFAAPIGSTEDRNSYAIIIERCLILTERSEALSSVALPVRGQPIYRRPTPGLTKERITVTPQQQLLGQEKKPAQSLPPVVPVVQHQKTKTATERMVEEEAVLYGWMKAKRPVLVHLVDGRTLEGQISDLRRYTFCVGGVLCMKVAISTVQTAPEKKVSTLPSAFKKWYDSLTAEQKTEYEKKKSVGRAAYYESRRKNGNGNCLKTTHPESKTTGTGCASGARLSSGGVSTFTGLIVIEKGGPSDQVRCTSATER